jgi:hypothetical protein
VINTCGINLQTEKQGGTDYFSLAWSMQVLPLGDYERSAVCFSIHAHFLHIQLNLSQPCYLYLYLCPS